MSIENQINRLLRLDMLIQSKSTGTPKELANKFSLSERQIYSLLNILRNFGGEIYWNEFRRTYSYKDNVKLVFGYTKK